ncbi:unnamed protein product [Brachionus calyciflorus]|uniref:CCHC-type domain-containing protein n=1 Tax=Brachionus calyciflorus TaxID=104777 RepID=A0A814JAF0_9BILA|nr:unnamed protein product [Brachionus calyciflorus]
MTQVITNFFEAAKETINPEQSSTQVLNAIQSEMRTLTSVLENKQEEKVKKNNKITTSSQPTFSGCEDVMEWIRITEKNLIVSDVADEFKVMAAGLYLRGDAEKSFEEWLQTQPKLVWDDFKKQMVKEYVKPEVAELALSKLRKLSQTGDLREYAEEFKKLTSQLASPMSEADKISYFKNGLKASLKPALILNKPTTLKEAIRIASEIYYSGDRAEPVERSSINAISKTYETKTCYFCKKPGHLKYECRKLAETKKNNYSQTRYKSSTHHQKTSNLGSSEKTRSFNRYPNNSKIKQQNNQSYRPKYQKSNYTAYRKNGRNVNSVEVEEELSETEEVSHVGMLSILNNSEENVDVWKKPTDLKELGRFLAICKLKEKSIKEVWYSTRLLFIIINRGIWEWNSDCDEAFKVLSEKLDLSFKQKRELNPNEQKNIPEIRAITNKSIIYSDSKVISDANPYDVATTDILGPSHVQEVENLPELIKGIALIGKNDLEVEVIFDTGAKRSVIPENLVIQNGFPVGQKVIKAVVANNEIHKTNLTEKLRIIFKGLVSELEFIILPRDNILLGMDWFVANNASIDPSRRTILFRSRKYVDFSNDMEEDQEFTVNSADIDDEDYDEDFESSTSNLGISTKRSC